MRRSAIPDAAYCGPPPSPELLGQSWNLDPWLLGLLFVLLVALLAAAPKLTPRRRAMGVAGLFVLAIAFISPLCALTVSLFSARAVHHLVVSFVAAPLLAVALPAARVPPGATVAFVFAVAMWLWHWPAAYAAALGSTVVYWALQLALLGSAVALWQSLAAGAAAKPIAATGVVLGTMAQMSLLGALVTFAPRPLYAAHFNTPYAWGLTPLADQQLAGLIMWVPPVVLLALPAALFARAGWRGLSARPT